MRTYLGLVAVVFAVGCNSETIDVGETTSALTKHCRDPEGCPLTNGGGTYTEELGNAHIGPDDFMIVQFINTGSAPLLFIGRGIDRSNAFGNYTYRAGRVEYARYGSTTHRAVVSVTESLTMPTFTLATSNGPIYASGANLAQLELVLSFDDHLYTVSFGTPTLAAITPDSGSNGAVLQDVAMRWNAGDTKSANPATYCTRAPLNGAAGTDDWAVFQQGISVDPLTSVMSKDNTVTTLSCRRGAVATARWWNYIYRGTAAQDDMFEAAMHMKRASYCGDDAFFTRRNTDILVWDNAGNQTSPITPTNMEASWGRVNGGPIHAVCVTGPNRRRPGALYEGDNFDRTCNGAVPTIPSCVTPVQYPLGMLADRLAP